jgi:hypothetical protein
MSARLTNPTVAIVESRAADENNIRHSGEVVQSWAYVLWLQDERPAAGVVVVGLEIIG